MSDNESASPELHPLTRRVLSRRRFLSDAGRGSAAVAFLGITFTVTGCGDDDTTSTTTTAGDATGTTVGDTIGTTAGDATGTTAAGDTLYGQLGGYESITAVMTDFVSIVGADERINAFFATTDLENLTKQLADFTANATGGPEEYTGRDMQAAHEGLGITQADFDALVEDLGTAMTNAGVPADVQAEVVDALAPLSTDIVEA